jgi:hypothetical protein
MHEYGSKYEKSWDDSDNNSGGGYGLAESNFSCKFCWG